MYAVKLLEINKLLLLYLVVFYTTLPESVLNLTGYQQPATQAKRQMPFWFG
jgi:hypothetical protein